MMEESIQLQINEINKKLDYIIEEIEFQKRNRLENEDLKEDLMRIGKDVYDTAIIELNQIHEHVDTREILHFIKYMIRNVGTINKVVQQLESIKDFLIDFNPLLREITLDFMKKLDEYDRKDYFGSIKEGFNILENILKSFNKNDVKLLGDNIVTILTTVKNLTQPDMLNSINNALNIYKKLDFDIDHNVTLLKTIKEIKDPETLKGIYFTIKFLQNLVKTNQTDKN